MKTSSRLSGSSHSGPRSRTPALGAHRSTSDCRSRCRKPFPRNHGRAPIPPRRQQAGRRSPGGGAAPPRSNPRHIRPEPDFNKPSDLALRRFRHQNLQRHDARSVSSQDLRGFRRMLVRGGVRPKLAPQPDYGLDIFRTRSPDPDAGHGSLRSSSSPGRQTSARRCRLALWPYAAWLHRSRQCPRCPSVPMGPDPQTPSGSTRR